MKVFILDTRLSSSLENHSCISTWEGHNKCWMRMCIKLAFVLFLGHRNFSHSFNHIKLFPHPTFRQGGGFLTTKGPKSVPPSPLHSEHLSCPPPPSPAKVTIGPSSVLVRHGQSEVNEWVRNWSEWSATMDKPPPQPPRPHKSKYHVESNPRQLVAELAQSQRKRSKYNIPRYIRDTKRPHEAEDAKCEVDKAKECKRWRTARCKGNVNSRHGESQEAKRPLLRGVVQPR